MNRIPYFEYIDDKLHILARRIETRGKLNILDINVQSENFFMYFFNLLFDYNLENLNKKLQNVEAIDLIDYNHKIIIQVSATASKQKVESALSKAIIKKYKEYTFKFISIAKDTSNLKQITYSNPYSIEFNPNNDIYDVISILNTILHLEIDKLKQIYEFIKKELGKDVDIIKLDSNIATIINILSKEEWNDDTFKSNLNIFDIDRKIEYNQLNIAKVIIEDYRIYHTRVDEKYSEYDKLGVNKSKSVLDLIRKQYLVSKSLNNSDEIFWSVIDKVKNIIFESANYQKIPIDELELCVNILVVDAFIRCKVFENPENYNYVTT